MVLLHEEEEPNRKQWGAGAPYWLEPQRAHLTG